MFHNAAEPRGRLRGFDERDTSERRSVEDKYLGKQVVVGEAGWPSKGGFNGAYRVPRSNKRLEPGRHRESDCLFVEGCRIERSF